MSKKAPAIGLGLVLAFGSAGPAAAQVSGAIASGGQAVQGVPGGPEAAAGSLLSSPASRFLSELDFSAGRLNALTLPQGAPNRALPTPEPEAPGTSRPEAALLFISALAASPGAVEEKAARQVLVEYSARPSIRADVEKAIAASAPASRKEEAQAAVKALRELGGRLDGMRGDDRLRLFQGLADIRRRLYPDSGKTASRALTRANLDRFFDDTPDREEAPISAGTSGKKSPPPEAPRDPGLSVWEQGGSMIITPLPVPFPGPVYAPKKGRDSAERGFPLSAFMSFIGNILSYHIRPVPPERLLMPLARLAKIGARGGTDKEEDSPARESSAERRGVLAELAGDLAKLMRGTEDARFAATDVVKRFVERGLVDLGTEDAVHGFLREVVAELDDPYSHFLDPKEARDLQMSRQGQYVGIGITPQPLIAENGLVVQSVRAGFAADEAGLKSGDRIVEIDGKMVKKWTDRDLLKGDPGSVAELKVLRDGIESPVVFLIPRQAVPENPLVFSRMVDGAPGVGYLYLGTFNANTDDFMRAELQSLRAQGMKSLILDMRWNYGGLLSTANRIASLFLKKGLVVEWLQDKGDPSPAFTTTDDGEYSDVPIVILVHHDTASSAEILTAALREHGRAAVLGAKTWGKGVGQGPFYMYMGFMGALAILYLTVHRWLTPLKNSIHSWLKGKGGIEPDVPLPSAEAQVERDMANISRALDDRSLWDPAADGWVLSAARVAAAAAALNDNGPPIDPDLMDVPNLVPFSRGKSAPAADSWQAVFRLLSIRDALDRGDLERASVELIRAGELVPESERPGLLRRLSGLRSERQERSRESLSLQGPLAGLEEKEAYQRKANVRDGLPPWLSHDGFGSVHRARSAEVEDLIGRARVLESEKRFTEAADLYREAIDRLLFIGEWPKAVSLMATLKTVSSQGGKNELRARYGNYRVFRFPAPPSRVSKTFLKPHTGSSPEMRRYTPLPRFASGTKGPGTLVVLGALTDEVMSASQGETRMEPRVWPRMGVWRVVVHGLPEAVLPNGGWNIESRMSPKELAELLALNGHTNQPIELISCSTGGGPLEDGRNFARDLAKRLKVDVLAPSDVLNMDAMKGRGTVQNEGGWYLFRPDGSRETLPERGILSP